jgi:hypothetical protein
VSRITGATFRALYELRTRSESERESIKAALRAGSLTGTWNASTSFSRSMERVSRLTQVDTVVFADLPNGIPEIPNDPGAIVQFATSLSRWMNEPGRQPFTFDWGVADYEILGLPSRNPNRVDRQRAILDDLSRRQNQALTYINSIDYARNRPLEFNLTEDQERALAGLESELRSDLDKIWTQAANCYDLLESCSAADAPDITRFVHALPKRKALPNAPGACRYTSGVDPQRFASVGGGCLDMSSGLVWSATATGHMSASDARNYCSQLTEGGVSGWSLPTVVDLQSFGGPDRVSATLLGIQTGWFWTSEGRRANPMLGTAADMDPRFTLSVVCRRRNTET